MSDLVKILAALALLAFALAVSGCVTAGTLPARAAVCALPDRIPALRTLVPGPAEVVVLDSDTQVPVVAVQRYYRLGPHVLKVTFVGEAVALIDTDATNAEAPVYYDAGLLDARGRVLAHPAPSCRWRAFTPPVDV